MISNIMMGASTMDWANIIVNAIEKFIGPLLIVLCSVGTIYAIIVGIKMMKAEKKEDMEDNKRRLINIGISIVAVIVLIAVFYGLKAYLKDKNIEEVVPGDLIKSGKD